MGLSPQEIHIFEDDYATKETLCGPVEYTVVATESTVGDANSYFTVAYFKIESQLDHLSLTNPLTAPFERELDVTVKRKFLYSTKEDNLNFRVIELNCDMVL